MFSGWLHKLFYNADDERNDINKKVKELCKPSVLTQGQQLHNNQAAKVNALTPNLLAFNEPIATPYSDTSPFINTNTYATYAPEQRYANGDRYSNANTYATKNTYLKGREGFGNMQTTAQNTAAWQDTTTVSTDYAQKIDQYKADYPSLLADGRLYAQSTDRTTNYKQNTERLAEAINKTYNITANKEGCYTQVAGSDLVYQSDMPTVTLDTCKKRASDLAYAGFSIKSNADGQLGCSLTNDIAGNKAAGIATKPQTSLAFKTNKNAMVGSLLLNGQLGLFNGSTTDILDTDLTAVPGCSADNNSPNLINPESIVATWGGNCN
jgi:hypothetical protein